MFSSSLSGRKIRHGCFVRDVPQTWLAEQSASPRLYGMRGNPIVALPSQSSPVSPVEQQLTRPPSRVVNVQPIRLLPTSAIANPIGVKNAQPFRLERGISAQPLPLPTADLRDSLRLLRLFPLRAGKCCPKRFPPLLRPPHHRPSFRRCSAW